MRYNNTPTEEEFRVEFTVLQGGTGGIRSSGRTESSESRHVLSLEVCRQDTTRLASNENKTNKTDDG